MNLQELKNILSTSFDLDVWKNILLNILGDKIEYFTSPQKIVGENILCGGHIGSVRLDDGKTLGIIDIEVDDHITIKRNRKALRGMVKDYIDQQKIHALLVFFYNRNQADYRVSYIVKQTYFTPEGEFIKHESEPKRYTFLLGKNESCTTAALRLFDLIKKRREGSLYMLDLTEAFSVEKLNKEFFDKYVKHYRSFCEDIIDNDNCRAKEFGIAEKQDFKHDDNKPIRDYVKKMMGRLVFLYFLQKRGWMNGDYSYLHNLYKSKTEFHNDYLEQILEPLFFCVLNTKEDKRKPEDIANLGDVSGIPYLNGGLFEKDRLDDKEVVFKKSLFDDLFEFFSQYNFTIDENDPYDAEVGIDPEMLGHIFENLLEDNKDKGAFYTPKEIVQYMCKQSLIEHIKSKTQSKNWDEYIVKLIDKHILDENAQNNIDFISTISDLLKKVKICDPAIGSGAFPMGMLNELFHCRQILHGFTRNAKAFAPATIKREIIQDNIYGVDIEQGAVDIARLRFWLSLIVDAEEARPLPNFDYKIMCGNSLIPTFDGEYIELNRKKGVGHINIRKAKNKLCEMQRNFYSLSGTEKIDAEAEIKRTLLSIIEMQLNYELDSSIEKVDTQTKLFEKVEIKPTANLAEGYTAQRFALNSIKRAISFAQNKAEVADIDIPFFDWEIAFSDIFDSEDGGFDIVIANPPYGADIDDYIEIYSKKYPNTSHKYKDIYKYFFDLGFKLLCPNSVLCYITPNTYLRQPRYGDLRRLLLNYNVNYILDLGEKIFENAIVPVTISLVSNQKSKEYNVSFVDLTQTINFNNRKEVIDSFVFKLIDLNLWNDTSNNIFIENIRAKSENEVTLGDILDMKDAGINYQRVKVGLSEKGKSDLSSRLLYDGDKLDDLDVEYWKGKDIDSYYISETTNRYVRTNIPLRSNERVILNGEYFNIEPKLLWRQTAPYPICAVDNIGIWFGRSIQAGVINEKFAETLTYEYLCALLNSKYLRNLYETNVKEGGRVFPQVKLEKLRPLPIIIADDQQPYIEIVNQILEKKRENPQADTSALEAEIDKMVYTLYNLTPEEITLIENR